MEQSSSPAPASCDQLMATLLQDLAILCDGPSVDVRIDFDGGLIAMRSKDKLVFHEAAEGRWMRLGGAARARLLAGWIHEAAQQYRTLLQVRLGGAKTPDVA
jgi:hypothetical protein